MLLPVFLTLMLITLQPVCLFYTRAVMESAAAETARLMVTAGEVDDEVLKAFALRRLGAIPDVSIFHEGGPLSWDIALTKAEETGGRVGVAIEGSVRPLPVLGVFASPFGELDGTGAIRVSVDVSYEGRPRWLEGSYESWVAEEG